MQCDLQQGCNLQPSIRTSDADLHNGRAGDEFGSHRNNSGKHGQRGDHENAELCVSDVAELSRDPLSNAKNPETHEIIGLEV